jgi:hypothetical protein
MAEIRSIGPLTFGPDDTLFVADNGRAAIVAVDVADRSPAATSADAFDLDDLDVKLAAFLGCAPADVVVRDLEVHPRTHNVYLAVTRGAGDAAISLVVRIDRIDGSFAEVDLGGATSEIAIDDAPAEDDERLDFQLGDDPDAQAVELPDGRKLKVRRQPVRSSTVTDMSYVPDADGKGQLLVAGMSNEEFASTLRRIPFPFQGTADSNSLEIFHVAHGMWETASPIRTFIPYEGGRSILASYTCTPLVHIAIGGVAGGTHVKGRTVAELGAGNQPLDMVAFTQGGEEHVLICHSNHPVMKISCQSIDAQEGLTTPQEPRGVPVANPDVSGLTRLAKLNGEYILALQQDDGGGRHLRSLKTASL